MSLTRYRFDFCMGGSFEMSTADARRILPPHLEPMEVQHQRSVMGALALRVRESEVGEYDELIFSVITPPRLEPGRDVPQAAFFPFIAVTSTDASRKHGIERWRLPHHPEPLDFEFQDGDGATTLVVRDDGAPVVELNVTEHAFEPAVNAYHCFTSGASVGAEGNFLVDVFMEGLHSVHQEEMGELILHEHPMTSMLTLPEVSSYPFQEECYRSGVQTFGELERL